MPACRHHQGRLHHRTPAPGRLTPSRVKKLRTTHMGLKSRRIGKGGDAEVMMDINTTPLIDVMLVLLVMLIITIPIQLHAVNLEMPVGVPPSDAIKPEK